MTKKKITVIIVTVAILRFSITVLLIVAAIINIPKIMDTYFMNKVYVPEPEITYMEFPIRIEYIVNGETKVIEDTMICEYKGYKKEAWIEKLKTGGDMFPYTRLWESRLLNNDDPLILYKDNEMTVDCYFGSANYYMDDASVRTGYPLFRVWQKNAKAGEAEHTDLTSPQLLSNYGIEIIDCTLPEPIVNSFK